MIERWKMHLFWYLLINKIYLMVSGEANYFSLVTATTGVLWWREPISHEKQMYWTFILNNFVFRIIIVISSHGNISCLLAIACKILVASTQFSVALVTRKGAISDPGLSIVALIIVTLSNHGHQQPGDQLEFM